IQPRLEVSARPQGVLPLRALVRVIGDDGGKVALLGCHRSASAALGSSRPAAIRRNVVTRLRSSSRVNDAPLPSSLLLSGPCDQLLNGLLRLLSEWRLKQGA